MTARFPCSIVGILIHATTHVFNIAPAHAQPVAIGAEFQVNTFTTDNQQRSDLAVNQHGEFIVVWDSASQDGSSYGIFGQRFDSAGSATGAELQINAYTTGRQIRPEVALSDDGSFVVVWESYGQDGSQYGVFGRRFDSAGTPLGGEFQADAYTTSFQRGPDVAFEDDGDFVVVWSTDRPPAGLNIAGQRYDSAGNTVGATFLINTYTTNGQRDPAVAITSDGGFVVAWESYLQDGSQDAVAARRYDSAGNALGNDFQVNTYTTYSQLLPVVAAAPDGGFLVVWNSGITFPAIYDIFGQRYDSSGAAVGGNFQVNAYTTLLQAVTDIGIDDDGNSVVIWQDGSGFLGQDGDQAGVFGQRLGSSDAPLGSQFQVNTYTSFLQQGPSMSMNDAGEFVVSWTDDDAYNYGTGNGQDGDGAGVFGRRYGSPCSGTQPLTPGQWRMISLPCNPGDDNTVADVFDDMTGVYGTDWIVFDRDEAAGNNVALGLGSPLEFGQGYWIKTNDTGETIDLGIAGNRQRDIALTASATGVQNLLGHPFPFEVCWDDVRVIDGGSVLTLDQADPGGICQTMTPGPTCIMSRIMYQWSGAAFSPFDGQTPGAEGSLIAFEGFWAKAFKSGISLRVPRAASGSCDAGSRAADGGADLMDRDREWHVRLTATSGALADHGNVLGHQVASSRRYDSRDLVELPPFGDPYLTVVFPHPHWGDHAADYATDFHPPSRRRDRWRFEVLASQDSEITLRWEGPPEVLRRSRLVDRVTGRRHRVQPGASYTFNIEDGIRRFKWVFVP